MEEPSETEGRDGPERTRVVLRSVVLVVLALGVGFAAFQLLSLLKEAPGRGATPPLRTAVRVEAAARSPHLEVLTGYGRARALRASQVSAELSATVTWVSPRLEAGHAVASGEELVRLDDKDARSAAAGAAARKEQAETALERARIDLENLGRQLEVVGRELEAARRELRRIEVMVPAAATPSEVDRQRMQTTAREQALLVLEGRERLARADIRMTGAEIAAADAALDKARSDLSRTTVRAPYGGSIVTRHAQIGMRVAPGAALFDIVDLSAVEVPVSLPAGRFGEVRVGARASVRLREGGAEVWTGTVTRIAPAVDAATRTFHAYLDIVGEAGAAPVPPGAFVVADVDGLVTHDVYVVPRVAFVGDALYVAEPATDDEDEDKDEAIVRERRPDVVRWLAESVLISGGLEPGERIVVTNVEQIAAGARVRLVRDDVGESPERGGAAGADR